MAECLSTLSLGDPLFSGNRNVLLFGGTNKAKATTVLTKFASSHRARTYTIIAEQEIAGEIRKWIVNTGLQPNLARITVIMACRGHPERAATSTQPAISRGSFMLGATSAMGIVSPEMFLSWIQTIPRTVQINLLLPGCYSGQFITVGNSMRRSIHPNLLLYTASSAKAASYGLRSVSGVDRASLFAVAVTEEIAAASSRTTVEEYAEKVKNTTETHTSAGRSEPHDPQ